ncbi:MAG TPA: DUF1523 family protein [Thermohalobaculum sp.]|nr:DUF1523 family protein [Thermohalobaculum sp.]
MRKVKWTFLTILAIALVGLFHYSLPSRDIVRIVGTDVKRMDVGTGGWWWAEPDASTSSAPTRDVRFINAFWPGGTPRVYRNEDTNWGYPPYLKFDSSNVTANGQGLVSTEAQPIWVVVTHYGWRIELLSMFPNAVKIRRATGPDETLVPWFNIVFLTALATLILATLNFLRKLRRRHVDPVIDDLEDRFSSAVDSADAGADAARDHATGLYDRLQRWLDSWRPKHKRRYPK